MTEDKSSFVLETVGAVCSGLSVQLLMIYFCWNDFKMYSREYIGYI